ncbi:hypothetical protein AUP68_10304 [Ilyonectria robusta]
MTRAVSYGQYSMFWHTLQAVSQQQPCNPQGARGITWFTLPSDPPEFDICGACMAGTIASMRMTHLFKPKHFVGASEARLCSFNIYGYARAFVLANLCPISLHQRLATTRQHGNGPQYSTTVSQDRSRPHQEPTLVGMGSRPHLSRMLHSRDQEHQSGETLRHERPSRCRISSL